MFNQRKEQKKGGERGSPTYHHQRQAGRTDRDLDRFQTANWYQVLDLAIFHISVVHVTAACPTVFSASLLVRAFDAF